MRSAASMRSLKGGREYETHERGNVEYATNGLVPEHACIDTPSTCPTTEACSSKNNRAVGQFHARATRWGWTASER
jgi:hypothetical protein